MKTNHWKREEINLNKILKPVTLKKIPEQIKSSNELSNIGIQINRNWRMEN